MNYYCVLNNELQGLEEESEISCLTDVKMLWERGVSMLTGFIPFGANFSMTTEEIQNYYNSSSLRIVLKRRIIDSIQDAIKRLESDVEKLENVI